jgi:hypothetical protein
MILEKGNTVHCGAGRDQSVIRNQKTGDEMMLRLNGKASYMMDLKFEDGEATEVSIDSGAEESVCPVWWGSKYGLKPATKWMDFTGAGGRSLGHYGEGVVRVSTF